MRSLFFVTAVTVADFNSAGIMITVSNTDTKTDADFNSQGDKNPWPFGGFPWHFQKDQEKEGQGRLVTVSKQTVYRW